MWELILRFYTRKDQIKCLSFTEQKYGGSCESDNECVGDLMCRDGDSGLQCLCATHQYYTGFSCRLSASKFSL